MRKIKILLTFDHELPLGGIYTNFEDSLFNPTNDLLAVANEINVPLNLFTDILSYEKFKSIGRTDFHLPYEKQIQACIQQNHDVQLHLHPHWIDTTIDNYQFITDTKYSLGDFANQEGTNSISNIVKRSVLNLQQIINSDSYQCVAFRAGGYAIQPATAEIISALYNNGIRIDSSISPGYYFQSDLSTVDFSNVPKKYNWFLSKDGNITKEGEKFNSLFEVPIPGKNKSIFELPTFVKMKMYPSRKPLNRGYMIHNSPKKSSWVEKVKKAKATRMLTFDNYTYSSEYLMKILANHLGQFSENEDVYLSAIGHPKTMGEYSLNLMREFVYKSKEKYGDSLEFTTFQKIHAELKLD